VRAFVATPHAAGRELSHRVADSEGLLVAPCLT